MEPETEEQKEKRKSEPLPEVPGGEMTVEQAYEVLGIPPHERGNVEKIKMAYRKACMKYHPDKNPTRQEQAARVFTACNCAYHTLTTNNFDYERWAKAFSIPPMQTLEDVLQLALKGLDTFELEAMLRKRGDYRPHKDFGVNLSVPWSAGTKEDPTYDVRFGSEYSKTRELQWRQQQMMELEWRQGHAESVAGHSADRPWERVGGSGWEDHARLEYQAPDTRPDLDASSPEAAAVADEYNNRGLAEFKAKNFRKAYDLYTEAVRLAPGNRAYLGNRAATGLKLQKWRDVVSDCEEAIEADPSYVKGYVRLGQAHIGFDNKQGYVKAIAALERALELEPDSKTAKKYLKEAAIGLEAEDSD